MEEKLINIITIGVIIYVIMIVSRLIKERKGHYERLKKDYKKQEMYVNKGLLIVIIIIIKNIYYNLIYDKLSLDITKPVEVIEVFTQVDKVKFPVICKELGFPTSI